MKRVFIATTLLSVSFLAAAQYASPRATQPALSAGIPVVAGQAAQSGMRPIPGQTQTRQQGSNGVPTGVVSTLCFEPIDARDTALSQALRANSLLCPTITKAGMPIRLRSAGPGELTAEVDGPPTVWHRAR